MTNNVLLLAFTFILFSLSSFSQNAPETSIGSASACPGTIVSVPLNLIGSPSLGAISLRIEYDGTVLSYVDPPFNIDTAFSNAGILSAVQNPVSGSTKKLMISWVDASGKGKMPSNVINDTLCELRFRYYGGSTYLTFNNSSNQGGDCEYGDSIGNVLNDIPTSLFYNSDSIYTGVPPNQPDTIIGSSVICTGMASGYSTTNISGITYSWSNTCNFTDTSSIDSIVYNPPSGSVSGQIYVIASNSCGSSSPKSFFVTVDQPSTPGTSAFPTSPFICQGVLDTLEVSGGTLGTNSFWRWYSGSCGSVDTIDTGALVIVSVSITTTYYVRAEGACNTTSCISTTLIVGNVPVIPANITGTTNPCKNSNVTYRTTLEAGVTYTWTSPAGWTGSSTGNSINFLIDTLSGYLSVFGTNSCGNSLTDSIYVTVADTMPQKPDSVKGPLVSCYGTVQVYFITNVPGVTYYWTIPSDWSGSSSDSAIATMVGTIPGNIIVIPGNGCGYGKPSAVWVRSDYSIPSYSGVIAGRPYVSSGWDATYRVSDVQGVTYNWTAPGDWTVNGPANRNQITYIVGVDSGEVTVTPSNTCGNGPPSSFAILGFDNGINNLAAGNELSADIYPNPLFNSGTIEYYLPEQGKVILSFYNILGENIYHIDEGFKLPGQYQINFIPRNYPPGIYTCKVELNSGKNVYRRSLRIVILR